MQEIRTSLLAEPDSCSSGKRIIFFNQRTRTQLLLQLKASQAETAVPRSETKTLNHTAWRTGGLDRLNLACGLVDLKHLEEIVHPGNFLPVRFALRKCLDWYRLRVLSLQGIVEGRTANAPKKGAW